MTGRKTPPEVSIQVTDTKVVGADGTNMSQQVLVPPGSERDADVRRKNEVVHLILRLLCLTTSIIALSLMVTAKEAGTVSIYGFDLPLYSKWSYSDSFEYLVGVTAAVAVHSLLQLVISGLRVMQRSAVIPSQNHAWLVFAGDQIFAYALMSAGSAASGVTNLNRTGIHHSSLPNFCKPLRHFCDRVAVSIALTFFSFFLIAISTVLDVIWLSNY